MKSCKSLCQRLYPVCQGQRKHHKVKNSLIPLNLSQTALLSNFNQHYWALDRKASFKSRALIKVHALISVCISTGLLTHILTDKITTEAVIRALQILQMRHGTQISHVQADWGSQFLNIGSVGSIPNGSPGKLVHLLVIVNAIRISTA